LIAKAGLIDWISYALDTCIDRERFMRKLPNVGVMREHKRTEHLSAKMAVSQLNSTVYPNRQQLHAGDTTNSTPMKHASIGFSLIELLVVIAIAAILAGLAVPSFQSMIASSNLTSTTNDLITTLARAKSDAIRRGQRVTVCMSADGAACATTGDWTQGWIMFNDDDHSDAAATVESTNDITAVNTALTNNIVIRAKSSQPYFSYSADGQAKLMNSGSGAGTLRVCSPSSALTNDTRARDIKINWVGRVTLDKPTGVAASCPAP